MKCENIEALLDDHALGAMPAAERDAFEMHLAYCENCRSAWRASRVLAELAKRPAPALRPELLAEATAYAAAAPIGFEQRSFWLGAGAGGALAASLVAALLILGPSDSAAPVDPTAADPAAMDNAHSIPALTMALNETRDVTVAIDSARALDAVQIRIVLAGGIGLENLAGRDTVTWSTGLDRGINRLTLPVVALESGGGELLVEVGLGSRRQVFVVHVDVEDPDFVNSLEPMSGSSV